MDRSSKNRLTEKEIFLFSGDTLFDKIARTVCRAGCLPRKELFESWEVARRVRRRFRGGRVIDLACGHGLLAWLLILLDDSSPEALAIDKALPPSATKLGIVLVAEWPRLAGRVRLVEEPLEQVKILHKDLVVSAHACGSLTDQILERAVAARARLALLPCCHDLNHADQGGLEGWLEGPLAVDATRAVLLKNRGYAVQTQLIPADITPCNRLILGEIR